MYTRMHVCIYIYVFSIGSYRTRSERERKNPSSILKRKRIINAFTTSIESFPAGQKCNSASFTGTALPFQITVKSKNPQQFVA